jgi:hypothetical protein
MITCRIEHARGLAANATNGYGAQGAVDAHELRMMRAHSEEAFAALEAALATFFHSTAETERGQAPHEATVASATTLLGRRALLLVLHGRLATRWSVILALGRPVLALWRTILALGRAIARLGVLRVTALLGIAALLRVATLLLVVILSGHGER